MQKKHKSKKNQIKTGNDGIEKMNIFKKFQYQKDEKSIERRSL